MKGLNYLKKTIGKKQAATGRGVKCSRCYINMVEQATIEGIWNWHCQKCGLHHQGRKSGQALDNALQQHERSWARDYKLE